VEACKPKKTIPTVKHGGATSCCGGALMQEGLCTSQNRWHHEERKVCGYIEATSQDSRHQSGS
jgi:hypothetical protein